MPEVSFTGPIDGALEPGGRTRPVALLREAPAVIGQDAALASIDVLSVLHSPLLKPVAVRYWARAMRSPMGELCFAGHSRRAEAEMRALGREMAARITRSPALTELLRPLERG